MKTIPKPEVERLGLSIPEFAGLAGPGITTIYKQIKLGNLHVTKVGSRTLVPIAEARRFVQPKGE